MYWFMLVDEGIYEVNLFFVECLYDINDEGFIVFDMFLNGNLVFDNFSIYVEVGFVVLKKIFIVFIL